MNETEIRYQAAATLQEAEELLRSSSCTALLLAGGTDLFGALKDRIHGDRGDMLLVDLKTIPGLDSIAEDKGELVIGALVRVADVARSELIRARLPMLAEAAESVASPQLREMGTVGGNLCQEPRCWYYRYPDDGFHCHRKGGELCAAAVGDNRYHSIYGSSRVVDPPCVVSCPNHTAIPGYFEALKRLDLEAAARSLVTENPIPAITGRICPHLCESGCNRGSLDESLSIRGLEREVGDYILNEPAVFLETAQGTGKSIAVVGSGPAGLAAAFYLRRQGHGVTVLERETRAGGMLALGIPRFRLSPKVVARVCDLFRDLGVEFRFGVDVGRDVSLQELETSFDAVIIGCGASLGARIGIEGEDATVSGLEYLRHAALDDTWKEKGTVLVIGGGNVAVDSAMTALDRGASSVVMACLESRSEMPAFEWEIDDALNAGVRLKVQWGPRSVRVEDGSIAGVDMVQCTSVFDENGAFCPTLDESARDFVPADKVVMAVGQRVDEGWFKAHVHEGAAAPSTVVCGDAKSGPATVVEAIASGREAAASVHLLLTGESLPIPTSSELDMGLVDFDGESPERKARELDLERPQDVREFVRSNPSLCRNDVAGEAGRCLNCSCMAVSPSDLAPALMALDARIETNRRVLRVSKLLSASIDGSTILDSGEIILAARVPVPDQDARAVFQKFRERKSIDFPIVNVAVQVSISDGVVRKARVCAGAVAPMPVRLHSAEKMLVGQAPTIVLCERAARAAVESARPLRRNKYKQQLLGVLLKRSLQEAMELDDLEQLTMGQERP